MDCCWGALIVCQRGPTANWAMAGTLNRPAMVGFSLAARPVAPRVSACFMVSKSTG